MGEAAPYGEGTGGRDFRVIYFFETVDSLVRLVVMMRIFSSVRIDVLVPE